MTMASVKLPIARHETFISFSDLSLISSRLVSLGLSNSPLHVSMPTFHVQSLPSLDLFLITGKFSYEYELFIFQKTKIFTYSLVR